MRDLLKSEIDHIFESGPNEIRIYEMIKRRDQRLKDAIQRRYKDLDPRDIQGHIWYNKFIELINEVFGN